MRKTVLTVSLLLSAAGSAYVAYPMLKREGSGGGAQLDKQAESARLVEEGMGHWQRKNWEGAYNSFSEAHKLTPTEQIEQYMNNAQRNVVNAEKEREWLEAQGQ